MGRDVGVVVVAYNSAPVLPALLESLPAALGGLTAAVVVVDNGSSDDSVGVAEAIGGCTVVRGSNVGYAGGVNAGVAALPDVEAVLVLNPDVRLAPHSVETLLATMRSTGAGIVAPRVLEPDGRQFRSLRREPTLLRAVGLGRTHRPVLDEYVSDPEAYERRHAVDWALGAALMVDRRLHDALDGWDESYFLYSEETDFSLRARDAGRTTLYEPSAVVTHVGGASGRDHRTHVMQILNRVRLYRRRHRLAASAAYFALTLAGETSRAVRGRRESRSALTSLLRPSRRPVELGCSGSYLPR